MSAATKTRQDAVAAGDKSEFDDLLQRPVGEVRQDLLQMKMENEIIMAECRVRPRDMNAIKRQLAELLRAFPELAEDAIYSKPVGKDRDGKEKFAEGLSIRAAEVLSEAYGFNRVRCDATPLPDGNAKVEATFTDFQNGRIWQDGGVVARKYKAYGGQIKEHAEDRFWGVVVKAEASRRIREVINRSVNAALKAWFENECRKVLSQVLDDEKVDGICNSFRSVGVKLDQLEAVIGRPRAMGWTVQDRQHLLGIWNAIKTGETTPAEAFAVESPQSGRRVKRSSLTSPEPVEIDDDGDDDKPHVSPSRESATKPRGRKEPASEAEQFEAENPGPKGSSLLDNTPEATEGGL